MAKRFDVRDLQGLRPEGEKTRPIQGFVNPGAAPRRIGGGLDITPVTSALQGIAIDAAQRGVKADVLAGTEEAQQDSAQFQAIQQALEKAASGAKDEQDRLRKQKAALRSLVRSGVAPEALNPAWQYGAARAEANKALNQAARNLESQVQTLGRVEDDDGNLIEPPDATAFLQKEMAAVLSNPMVQRSQAAREVVAGQREKIENDFLSAVARERTARMQDRARKTQINRTISGFDPQRYNGEGPPIRGLLDLAEADQADITGVLGDLSRAMDHYRDVEGSAFAPERFMESVSGAILMLADDNPAAAQRLLTRVKEVKVGNQKLGEDGRPEVQKQIAEWQNLIDGAGEREQRKTAQVENSLDAQFLNYVYVVGDENPEATGDQLFNMALDRLLEDPEAQRILANSPAAGLTPQLRGSFREQFEHVIETRTSRRVSLDAQQLEPIRRQLIDGEIDKNMAIGMAKAAGVSARVLGAFIKEANERSPIEEQARGHALWESIDSRSRNFAEGLSIPIQNQLADMGARYREAALDLVRQKVENGQSVDQAMRSPEMDALNQRFEDESAARSGNLAQRSTDILNLLNAGQLDKAQAALDEASPNANTQWVGHFQGRIDGERNREDEDIRGSTAMVAATRIISGAVNNKLLAGTLNEAEADRIISSNISQVFDRTREKIRSLKENGEAPPGKLSQLRDSAINEAVDEVLKPLLDDPEVLKLAKDEKFKAAGRLKAELDQFESFRQTGSRAEAYRGATDQLPKDAQGRVLVDMTRLGEIIDTPRKSVPVLVRTFGDVTPERVMANSSAKVAQEVLLGMKEVDKESRGKAWAWSASQTGAVGYQDILKGRATLSFQVSGGDKTQLAFRLSPLEDLGPIASDADLAAAIERNNPGLVVEQVGDALRIVQVVPLEPGILHSTNSLTLRTPEEAASFAALGDADRTKFFNTMGYGELTGADLQARTKKYLDQQLLLRRSVETK